jgi:uncharacterized membrane protein YphA (DoxX/SURF4 family)
VRPVTGYWSLVTWVIRIALGAVFITAAVYKIKDPAEFAKSIFNYHLAPGSTINAAAILLPWLELVTGIALVISPRLRHGAAWYIFAMLVVFTTAIAIAVARGLDITCGCFSPAGTGQRVGLMKIAENTLMILGAAFLLWRERVAARPQPKYYL